MRPRERAWGCRAATRSVPKWHSPPAARGTSWSETGGRLLDGYDAFRTALDRSVVGDRCQGYVDDRQHRPRVDERQHRRYVDDRHHPRRLAQPVKAIDKTSTGSITPATIGEMVRDARTAAGLSQSELGQRIGASRFWVAQFEKGKPSAELGLALKAIQALGLSVRVGPGAQASVRTKATKPGAHATRTHGLPAIDLGKIIATSTGPSSALSRAGWPAASRGKRSSKGS